MIANQQELEHTIQAIAKMYRLRDRETKETLHSAELRKDVIEGTEAMIRKLEKEVAEYMAKKYHLSTDKSDQSEAAA